MKVEFIETKWIGDVKLPDDLISKLGDNVVLAMTIQFIDNLNDIVTQLESAGKNVKLFKSIHGCYSGQILGCDIEVSNWDNCDYLYVGDGEFHPKAIAMNLGDDSNVYVYNPKSEKWSVFDRSKLEVMKKKEKVGIIKFLSSKNIGILVTTKSGQNQLDRALRLKKKLVDKNVYILMDDTINFASLEDFNFIDVFVNTACARIGYDDSIKIIKPIVNINVVEKLIENG